MVAKLGVKRNVRGFKIADRLEFYPTGRGILYNLKGSLK
jgi:hypothetical protein